MSIEDLLREAAAKGLTHLTLYPIDSNDGKSTYWNARATPSSMHSYIQVANYDPVEAVRLVLEALPRAPRRTPKKITATVTNEPGEPLSGMPAGADPLDLHDAPAPNGDLDKWLPKT